MLTRHLINVELFQLSMLDTVTSQPLVDDLHDLICIYKTRVIEIKNLSFSSFRRDLLLEITYLG
jgi:hypothetical protein